MIKTNAMRIMEQAGLLLSAAEYEWDPRDLSGLHAAEAMKMPPEQVFKTLVAQGDKTGICVFCIPVCCTLDLKKAAAASRSKKTELVPVARLLPLTGYLRGGCSPVAMKKPYPTFMDETAVLYDRIAVSAGVRGQQMLVPPEPFADFMGITLWDLTQ